MKKCLDLCNVFKYILFVLPEYAHCFQLKGAEFPLSLTQLQNKTINQYNM